MGWRISNEHFLDGYLGMHWKKAKRKEQEKPFVITGKNARIWHFECLTILTGEFHGQSLSGLCVESMWEASISFLLNTTQFTTHETNLTRKFEQRGKPIAIDPFGAPND